MRRLMHADGKQESDYLVEDVDDVLAHADSI
jgi:hypothetical protein